jgi:hypothetical protein
MESRIKNFENKESTCLGASKIKHRQRDGLKNNNSEVTYKVKVNR